MPSSMHPCAAAAAAAAERNIIISLCVNDRMEKGFQLLDHL